MPAMEEAHIQGIARTIQLALAPAFLLTAVASFLNVFATRLSRIVERTRALEEDPAASADPAAELAVLARRSRMVRAALTLGTGSALFIALVIGTAFLGFLLSRNTASLVAGLFVAAMIALTAALSCFLGEVTLAIRTLAALVPPPRHGIGPGVTPRGTPPPGRAAPPGSSPPPLGA
jgi:hypothetical protein